MEKLLSYGNEVFRNGLIGFIISSVLYIVLSFIAKAFLEKVIKKAKESRAKDGERALQSAETSFGFLKSILFGLINAITIVLILFQIKFLAALGTAVLGATSVLAIVVGFAAQDSTVNIIGGLFLSFYQPFVKGDAINIPDKNIMGRVKDIGLRHTTIQTIYNTTIIVPNSTMNSAIVENRQDDEQYTNYFLYTISYDSDVDLAMSIIEKLASEHELAIKDTIKVQVYNLKDFAIELRLIVGTKSYVDGFAMKTDLNYQVLNAFRNQGVVIPFPTSNVYVQKPE